MLLPLSKFQYTVLCLAYCNALQPPELHPYNFPELLLQSCYLCIHISSRRPLLPCCAALQPSELHP
jgi:hypothetical protein